MGNYDQMAAAVSELSGGRNVVLLDDIGLPSIYVRIPRGRNSELVAGLSDSIHPAFSVNGVEKSAFYYSKYQNIIEQGRAYSLAHRDPRANITFDAAKAACDAKGSGFHLSTMAEWAYIALWCRKNGTMPHGNNNSGRDVTYIHERGEESYKYGTDTGRTFTGSGPATWGHDWTKQGIQDFNGNVWEWNGGMRLVDGEIQVIPYNNAALGVDCDQSAASALWKAIKSDGTLVAPGTAGTLKYDGSSFRLVTTRSGTAGQSGSYSGMGIESGLTAPELAKILLIYPDAPGGDYGGDYHWWTPEGERLPICGGDWNNGASVGAFAVFLNYPRSDSYVNIGFRSAFVDL